MPIINPHTFLWTPDLITTEAWYDCSDTSTITDSSGAVSQLDDLSGNAEHVTQVTGSLQPQTDARTINGLNAIDFDGTEYLDIASRLGFGANPDIMVFCIAETDTNVQSNDRFWQLGNTENGVLAGSVGTQEWAWRFNDGSERYNSVTTGTPQISVHKHPSGGDYDSSSFFLNGTEQSFTNQGSPTNLPTSTVTQFYLGAGMSNSNILEFDGIIGELFVVESNSLDIQLRAEGYLAHKWGLTASLITGHTYKNVPPTA